MNNNHVKCLFVLVISLFLCSCGIDRKASNILNEEIQEPIKIGVTFESFVIERWQRERDIFMAKAQELGAEVNVQIAYGNLDEQISHIKYFIDKKMDVIVIIAADKDGLTEVIDEAKKEGIKVVAYDRFINDANIDLYISFDNIQVGRLMAEHMVKEIGVTGEVLLIMGPLSDNNVTLVMEGIHQVLNTTDIVVMDTIHCQGWQGEIGYEAVNEYLSQNGSPKGIICGNDTLSSNVIRALSENRLAGNVYVTGQDADLDACQRIVEGTQSMTVYKDVISLATEAAQLCINLAKNTDLNLDETMNNGTYDIPYKNIEVTAVDAVNMDTVIAGRYHQKKDIYLNIPSKNK